MKRFHLITMSIVSGFLMLMITAGFALEVAVDEIRTKPVKFINYQGKDKKPDPIRDIEEIGKILSRKIKVNERARYYLKYSIISAISKEEPDKYSAEIFSIDKDAKVGHIDIVRRITSSYLMSRYGYSRRDAAALSLFLTYYNATYRGNIKYFSSKYKSIVMKHINTRNAGISTKYWEWAGATMMLIPLTEEAQKGKLDSIDPGIISDEKTIEQVRKDEKNIPYRKDMADIKERILEKDRTKLEEEKEKLGREREKIEKEAEPIEKKKEDIRKKEEELRKEKEELKEITEPEKRDKKEEEIKEKEREIEAEKEEVQKKEKELKEKKEEIGKDEKKISDQETKIEEREKKLEEEKREIERDEFKRDMEEVPEIAKQKLEEKEKELDRREDMLREKELDKNIYASKLYYLKIKEYLEGGHYNNEMYMIDASTRKIIFKSPEENICGSRYDIFSGGVVVITHKGSHTYGHRLTILDRDTLEVKIHGSDNIFWRSFIEIRDGFIYVIVNDKGKHYLGKFNSNLTLAAKSKEEVNENTFISFYDNYVYINRLDKTIIVLNKDDLSFIDEIKP